MNIMYIADMNYHNYNSSGVGKKVVAQTNALKSLGVKVTLASFYDEKSIAFISNEDTTKLKLDEEKFHQKKLDQLFKAAYIKTEDSNYDVVYIRHVTLTFEQIRFMHKLKRDGIKIVYELPTYPYIKEKIISINKAFKDFKIAIALRIIFKQLMEKFYWIFTSNIIDQIVTYSDDDRIFGVPTIKINNGIDVDLIKPISEIEKNGDELHIIGVANISSWHGFDRLILGMADYKSRNKCLPIIFDVVGNGQARVELENLVREHELERYVIFHGLKFGEELDEIYNIASLGISSLGLHRINIFRASALKTREYLAKGLPILVTNSDTITEHEEGLRYSFIIESNEAPIDIEELIKFIENLKKRTCLVNDIRAFATQNLTWKNEMKKVIFCLNNENIFK